MKDLLEYIVKNLVNHPDDVMVNELTESGNINLSLTVNPEDMGLIIGKGGQTIHAIRKLLTVRAISENVRVNLQLEESAGSDRPIGESTSEQTSESAEPASEEVPQESEEKP